MGLYFIFELTKQQFCDGDAEFMVETYSEFSEYFSTFVDSIDVPISTISDNLDKLHDTGFVHVGFLNPRDECDLVEYKDKEHLYILVPLD